MKKIQLLFLLCSVVMVSCSDESTEAIDTKLPGDLTFAVSNTFGASAFTLDTEYTTSEGDKIKPTELRYWVSNIALKKSDGSTYKVPGSYYLIQTAKAQAVQEGSFTMPAAKRESVSILGIPAGEYTEVTFSIGVDSEHNDNLSLQAGELSIMQNMTNISWMWHTSYIFSKIGGSYTNASSVTTNFLFETGTNAQYKTITRTFAAPVTINGLKPAQIALKADASKLFAGIKITDAKLTSGVYRIGASTPELMAKLAANYVSAFELVSVQNIEVK